MERRLRRPTPSALRELYADRRLIVRRNLNYRNDHVIGAFEPLDERAIEDTSQWLGFEALQIASTQFGDAVYLRPGTTDDYVVYVTHHDGGETEVFAESVEHLLATLRQLNVPR